jgi:enhancing lycopene biosynthesis protein 2
VVDADAADVVEDDLNNIITTPGYLSSRSMAQVFEGIEKTITKLIEMVTLVMNT